MSDTTCYLEEAGKMRNMSSDCYRIQRTKKRIQTGKVKEGGSDFALILVTLCVQSLRLLLGSKKDRADSR